MKGDGSKDWRNADGKLPSVVMCRGYYGRSVLAAWDYRDGELTRQLLDANRIERYGKGVIFTAEDCMSNNGSKSTPALTADIWGDWREELILSTKDNTELRIFTTTIPTEHRMYTLMHDPVYRNGVVICLKPSESLHELLARRNEQVVS